MLGGACTYFYIKYKQEKQVTFASRVDETKKRYKNGVEVKPSEADSKKELLNNKNSIHDT